MADGKKKRKKEKVMSGVQYSRTVYMPAYWLLCLSWAFHGFSILFSSLHFIISEENGCEPNVCVPCFKSLSCLCLFFAKVLILA